MNAAHATALEALGDGTRRRVFELVAEGPRSVREIADDLPVSRPAVSQHLRVLKDAKLVRERADGARRLYSVEPATIADLRAYFDEFWDKALSAFKAEAEGREP